MRWQGASGTLRQVDLADFSLALFELTGRAALVTGGNTGLGQAFSVALAAAGADVCVVTIEDDGGVTRGLVEQKGSRYDEVRLDLTAPDAPARAVDRCVETYGRIDVLVNGAGRNLLGDVLEFDRASWDPMVDLNLTAVFATAHAAAQVMVAQGRGKIINVASLFSFLGGRRSPAYAATKHGVVGLTKAYCDELAEHGVQVNAIAPGYVATELTRATREDPELNLAVVERVPAGRWAEPADLMGALVFLASPASDFVNGQVLTIDGGYLVR